MTSSSSNKPPPSGVQPLIVTPEALSREQRRVAEDYQQRAALPGVLVGALVGHAAWNIKPLVLDHGVLKILRFSDPHLAWDEERFSECVELMQRVAEVDAAGSRLETGVSSDQIWLRRSFFQRSLVEVGPITEASLGAEPSAFAIQLLQQALDWKSKGLVHGHVCAQNILIEGSSPVVVDHLFRRASPQLVLRTADAAPELQGGEWGDFSADVFGLAAVVRLLLGDRLTEEQKKVLAAMQDRDACRRPRLEIAVDLLFSAQAQQTAPVSRPAEAPPAELKLGKVLGTNLSVAQSASSASVPPPAETAPPDRLPAPTAAETLEWLKGTVVLTGAVVQKIRDEMAPAGAGESGGSPRALPAAAPRREEPPASAGAAAGERGPAPDREVHEARRHSGVPRKKPRPGKRKEEERARKQSAWSVLLFLLVGVVLIVVLKRGFSSEPPVTPANIPFENYWSSNLPSRMRAVALAAVVNGDERAELVIVEDALRGIARPNVHADLLRIAFDPRWESELSPQDRSAALKLALPKLLEGSVRSIPALESMHPAVLLAFLASMDVSVEPPGALARVPLGRLAGLPAPYGPAYQALAALDVSSVADPSSRALAKLLVGDASDPVLQRFLGGDGNLPRARARLEILLGLERSKVSAEQVLQAIESSPGGALKDLLQWFSLSALVRWNDVPARAKLALISGTIPDEGLRRENYIDLLRFPIMELRPAAKRKLLQGIFSPDAEETLGVLAGWNNRLSRDQTAMLLTAMLLPGKEQYAPLDAWFDTHPDSATVLDVLAARRAVKVDDPFSVRAAKYLRDQNTPLSLIQLKKLVLHQEALVRALAYARLDPKDPEQVLILQLGAKREPLESLRNQIRSKLDDAGIRGDWPVPEAVQAPEEEDEPGIEFPEGMSDN